MHDENQELTAKINKLNEDSKEQQTKYYKLLDDRELLLHNNKQLEMKKDELFNSLTEVKERLQTSEV